MPLSAAPPVPGDVLLDLANDGGGLGLEHSVRLRGALQEAARTTQEP
jgi:hypothetical protein